EVPDPERSVGQGEEDERRVRRERLARRGLESLEPRTVELEEAALGGDPEHTVGALREIPDAPRSAVLNSPRGMLVLAEVGRLCGQGGIRGARHGRGEP